MEDWSWTLNWSDIRDDLVIGSCPMTTEDFDTILKDTSATAMLSLQTDECRGAFNIDYGMLREHADETGIPMVNAPMRDFDPPDQRQHLPNAVRALARLLSAGHKVYVHCTAGRNRAPLAVLGYLTFVEALTSDAAMAVIRTSRPESDPSWEAYHGCRNDLVDYLRDFIQVRAYHLSEEAADGDKENHWFRAEADIIRQAFLSPRSLPSPRLSPCRA